MSEYMHKSHHVSVLIYHVVCPATYRRVVCSEEVDTVLKDVCLAIAKRYAVVLLEIGTERKHVHFLLQSVPSSRPSKIATIVKSITAREIVKRVPTVKKQLWGGEFWSKGNFISAVGRHGSEEVIRQSVKNPGTENDYQRLQSEEVQLELF